jgi:hypothetical protein
MAGIGERAGPTIWIERSLFIWTTPDALKSSIAERNRRAA